MTVAAAPRVPVPQDLATRAAVVAADVGRRMTDAPTLAAGVEAFTRQSEFSHLLPWRPASLAQGQAGTAVLCAALDASRPGTGWDRAGHAALASVTEALQGDDHVDPSLMSGIAGLGVAAVALAAGRPRYERLLARVDALLLPRAAAAARRLDEVRGCDVSAFDLVTGLTGTAVHLLARRSAPAVRPVLDEVLSSVARLVADAEEPPRWHTPAHLAGHLLVEVYPDGLLNCGLAHGMPGPLALLAVAALDGVRVDATQDALRAGAAWLVEHAVDDPHGPTWPNGVALRGATGDTAPPGRGALLERGRDAWCYGTAGVARALWLAGTALGDEDVRRVAADAVLGVVRRPPEDRRLTSPTFCHGTAGLLQVVLRFRDDTGSPALSAAAAALVRELLDAHEPDSLLGYRNVEPGGRPVDHPGLLDGAPGVALALLAASGRGTSSWDRMFLLS